jgi:hypothetical protein
MFPAYVFSFFSNIKQSFAFGVSGVFGGGEGVCHKFSMAKYPVLHKVRPVHSHLKNSRYLAVR